MQKAELQAIFAVEYTALCSTDEGELGEKLDQLYDTWLQIARFAGYDNFEECPPLVNEIHLNDEIHREIAWRLFCSAYQLALRERQD